MFKLLKKLIIKRQNWIILYKNFFIIYKNYKNSLIIKQKAKKLN